MGTDIKVSNNLTIGKKYKDHIKHNKSTDNGSKRLN